MPRRAVYEADQAAFITFIGVFIPPVAVAIVKGWHVDVAKNFGLWCLGILPGMLHAFLIIAKHTRPAVVADPEALYIESPPPSVYHSPNYNHQQAPLPGYSRGQLQPGFQASPAGSVATAPAPRGVMSPFGDAGDDEAVKSGDV